MFAISAHLLLTFAVLFVVISEAKSAPFTAHNISSLLHGSRTTTAFQARQLTREHYVQRAEKNLLANLFARVDCAVPEPSTLACPCVDWDSCDLAYHERMLDSSSQMASASIPPTTLQIAAPAGTTAADSNAVAGYAAISCSTISTATHVASNAGRTSIAALGFPALAFSIVYMILELVYILQLAQLAQLARRSFFAARNVSASATASAVQAR
ncbi:hypothetical protein AURDEDRAFT_173084 [Auricularia subglabra TFB-10046 SS5]|nr:hypothetical protein AURDEDRAFT_173084 [Auricularia subglabra TFB-10046 SS5]